MNRIDQLKQIFQEGSQEELLAMLRGNEFEQSFKQLGQALLWEGRFADFDRLLSIGLLQLENGELEVLNLGLQLVPPGLPESAWGMPPLSELLEAGYKSVESALERFPELLNLFRSLAVQRQREAANALQNQTGKLPGLG